MKRYYKFIRYIMIINYATNIRHTKQWLIYECDMTECDDLFCDNFDLQMRKIYELTFT